MHPLGAEIVLGIILVALILFIWEPWPPDITALGIVIALIALGDYTEVSPQEGVSGFSNSATLIVLAMMIISAGIQKTGVIQKLGTAVGRLTGGSEVKQVGATIGLVNPISGIMSNTATVAILMPMVTDLANKHDVSPSKVLMPLSFASMIGGTLTLIGTSTNILASNIMGKIGRQSGDPRLHEYGMFEFTHLGILVSVVGAIYLLTVGRWLIPERVSPGDDLTDEYDVAEYVTEVVTGEESDLVGMDVDAIYEEFEVNVVKILRGEERVVEPQDVKVEVGDVLTIQTDQMTFLEIFESENLDLAPTAASMEDVEPEEGFELVEVVISSDSFMIGESLVTSRFSERYDGVVLALKRGGKQLSQRLARTELEAGDTLLVEATPKTVSRLSANRNFILVGEVEIPDLRKSKVPIAVAITLGVVTFAALNIVGLMEAALAGAFLMVVTGCLKPHEIYEAVSWDIIFLLAGVIPLGLALENTGGDVIVGNFVVATADFMPAIAVLTVFYLITAVLTNLISNNASVVLMVPVAIEAAESMGANPFAFVLAVTFAASMAFMTPIGFQTNLFVYGPGGYKFSDYIKVGGPLEFILAGVTALGVSWFWGLA
ncbi:MAG: SLC13 family permease [Halobacteria archaeon]